VTRRSAQHANEGIAVSGDVRYWMSVSEWLPSVTRTAMTDMQTSMIDYFQATRPGSSSPHPLRATRSLGHNQQKVEENDNNCYNGGGCQET